jgi:hypothetical protein
MKKDQLTHFDESRSELSTSELRQINGGEDGELAYYAGYLHVFTTAHLLTGGLSTIYYLVKKATS